MALSPIPFWYLRHGQTDWNAKSWSQGNVDIPLNDIGIAQAHEAAQAMRGRGVQTIIASPLSRARVTAEIVGEALGLPVQLDEELRECSFGVREGQPMSDWFHDWVDGHETPEGAEPFDVMRTRVVGAVNRALQSPAPVLVVAHGALFRGLRAAMGMVANVRTQNCQPMYLKPPTPESPDWALHLE